VPESAQKDGPKPVRNGGVVDALHELLDLAEAEVKALHQQADRLDTLV
jgi:hypothetical protein